MNELARSGGYFLDVIESRDGLSRTFIVGRGYTESGVDEQYVGKYENEFFTIHKKNDDGSLEQIIIRDLSEELRSDPPFFSPKEFVALVTANFVEGLTVDSSFICYKEEENEC